MEKWLPVVGWEGQYEVSDQGRVRSIDRESTDGRGRTRRLQGVVLRPSSTGRYPHVELGGRTTAKVHILVAEAFIGPRSPGIEVRHRDDDPANNVLSNLVYGSKSDNMRDVVRNGLHNHASKTHCKHGHPLPPKVEGARQRVCVECARKRGREWARRNRDDSRD